MTDPLGPIVSSAHLADSALPALSELEFALTMANHAFQRWMVRCMAAAGAQMSPLEVLILHQVAHRDRPKSLADLCLVLNIGDTHLANYAIRKLASQGLVRTGRKGKEPVPRRVSAKPGRSHKAFCRCKICATFL